MDKDTHWNTVYTSKDEDELSWFQQAPQPSLDMILAHRDAAAQGVVDIGAGASRLVDALLDEGLEDITLVDLAEHGLATTRARLRERGALPRYVVADATQWTPARRFGLWHDRAAFHFLTTPEAQAAYLEALRLGTGAGAIVIIATFAEDGPERCSGLPVQRYSPETLSARLGAGYDLIDSRAVGHHTPSDATQKFQYSVFRRLG
ncbi:class I SAM-dependent methyltransferase [Brevirhabdus sp.]|uniref:class I SAM-dependent methyltransferase n=1 Tax=Brevirhabdus sp. TaxID=2004514 RepID=UPI004057EE1F